ncbi:MAG: response regulator [Promethearchaeota archaeon]
MKKNVYIIEDNEKNMKLFKAILNLMPDIEVFEETQGDLGLELIKNGRPDLVILDIQLPEISGIDICIDLRKVESFKEIPIIAVTSFAMKGDRERILSAGFTDYFSKPIKVNEFRNVIKGYLKK